VLLYSLPLLKKGDSKAKILRHNNIYNVHKVGLYSARFLSDRVRVLLLNEFSNSTRTRAIKI
jgi:hypothetical protein